MQIHVKQSTEKVCCITVEILGHRKHDQENQLCFLHQLLVHVEYGRQRHKDTHLSLGSLMSGLAQIAHEKCQNGLEKKKPLHTHTNIDLATLLRTSKTHSQTRVYCSTKFCILLQFRADSCRTCIFESENKQITCVCSSANEKCNMPPKQQM